jgi:hypothetical protein
LADNFELIRKENEHQSPFLVETAFEYQIPGSHRSRTRPLLLDITRKQLHFDITEPRTNTSLWSSQLFCLETEQEMAPECGAVSYSWPLEF